MTTVSIAIATYNRSKELAITLRRFSTLVIGNPDKFELLIIDNNSSDETKAVTEEFGREFPGRVRYILEDRQGLSHARNRAVDEAQYDVVAFLDDDVDVEADWLINLTAAFESGDYAAVGGKAYLVYPRARPRWLGRRDQGYLTEVDLGDHRKLAKPDELFGVNLSVKKEWIKKVGGFRTDLGRIGACLLSSEETELLERIELAGGLILYEPSAAVGHRVPPERLRRSWFWSRSYWGHRGDVRKLPEHAVSLYELIRATWHIVLAGCALARTTLVHGLKGEEAFHGIVILAARLGSWVGRTERLAARR